MNVIEVTKPGEINITQREMPTISKGEALIKVKATGICGSDIHIYHGQNPFATYPRVIGHEVVGEIVEIAENVNNVKVGDRVILEPIEYCGTCYACKNGRPNVCKELKVRGVHKDGGFAEYISAKSEMLHVLPDNVKYEDAIMIEPFSIGAQVTSRGNVKANDLVLIYGAGPTGLSVLENAKIKGATVVMVDMNTKRLDFAKTFGADYVFNPSEVNVYEEINKISVDGANVIVDAVGNKNILAEAIKCVSVAGTVVCLGFQDVDINVSMLEITKKEVTLVGSRLQANKFASCVENFGKLDINTTKLITHVFDYTDVQKAVDLIENEPEKVGKIILKF